MKKNAVNRYVLKNQERVTINGSITNKPSQNFVFSRTEEGTHHMEFSGTVSSITMNDASLLKVDEIESNLNNYDKGVSYNLVASLLTKYFDSVKVKLGLGINNMYEGALTKNLKLIDGSDYQLGKYVVSIPEELKKNLFLELNKTNSKSENHPAESPSTNASNAEKVKRKRKHLYKKLK
jgi:hypothetical protein